MSARPTLLFLHGWGFDATSWDPLRAMLSDWPQRAIDRGYFGGRVDEQLGKQRNEHASEQVGEHIDTPFDAPVRLGNPPLDTGADGDADERADEKIIVIGHSFGFLDALMSLAQPTDAADGNALGNLLGIGINNSNSNSNSIDSAIALISINGFTRFSATDDFPEGVSPRVIDRMMKKISSAPEAVVDDFRRRCGWQSGLAESSLAISPSLPPSLSALLSPSLPPSAIDVERLLADLQTLRHGDGREAYRALVGNALPCLVLAGAQDAIVPAAMTQTAFADQTIVWHESGDHLLPTSATDWCAQQILTFLKTLSVDGLRGRLK